MHGSPGSLGIGSTGHLELHAARQCDPVSHPEPLHSESGCREAGPTSRGTFGRRLRKQSRQLNLVPTNTPCFLWQSCLHRSQVTKGPSERLPGRLVLIVTGEYRRPEPAL